MPFGRKIIDVPCGQLQPVLFCSRGLHRVRHPPPVLLAQRRRQVGNLSVDHNQRKLIQESTWKTTPTGFKASQDFRARNNGDRDVTAHARQVIGRRRDSVEVIDQDDRIGENRYSLFRHSRRSSRWCFKASSPFQIPLVCLSSSSNEASSGGVRSRYCRTAIRINSAMDRFSCSARRSSHSLFSRSRLITVRIMIPLHGDITFGLCDIVSLSTSIGKPGLRTGSQPTRRG